MTVRSKHNNLLNYFLYDEKDLSKAYIKSCNKFFKDIEKTLMLKNYSSWKHFETLKLKVQIELKKSIEISNRKLSHYYDIKTKKLRDKYITGDTYEKTN